MAPYQLPARLTFAAAGLLLLAGCGDQNGTHLSTKQARHTGTFGPAGSTGRFPETTALATGLNRDATNLTTELAKGHAGNSALYKGKTIWSWVQQLQSDNVEARREAAEVLQPVFTVPRGRGVQSGPIPEPFDDFSAENWPNFPIRPLIHALLDKDEAVSYMAKHALHAYGRRALPTLVEGLKDHDSAARLAAAKGLWEISGTTIPDRERLTALPPLLVLLKDNDPDLRIAATRALASIAGAAAVPGLGASLVNDKAPEVRDAAAKALWGIGPPAVPALLTALQSPDATVRKLAVLTIARINPPARKAVPALAELLKDPDDAVRGQVADVLGQMGDAAGAAVPALLEASKADDVAGRCAAEALKRIYRAPRSAAPALVKLLKDTEPAIRLKAAQILCTLEEGDRECLTTLVELVGRRDQQIRLGAVTLLARYGSAAKPAVPALIEIVRNETDAQARLAAINTLGCIGPDAKAAVPALKAALPDLKGAPTTPLRPGFTQADIAALQRWGPAMTLDGTIRAALKKIEQ
jgi:HEAT repeat protein